MVPKSGRPIRKASEIEAVRENIARHALILFRAEGFAAVSIRRLAKEVGCAPMTIYAHFDAKTDILRYLWADVLNELAEDILTARQGSDSPRDRLLAAANAFVAYWLEHPDRFRLVFMSGGINRADVGAFINDSRTNQHFQMIFDLVKAVVPLEDLSKTKIRTDVLVSGMIGIALCYNTIADYPWSEARAMTGILVSCTAA